MEAEILYDGYCEFCGQVVQFDGRVLSEAKMDKSVAAKLICDCPQAGIFRRRHQNILNGVEQVNTIVGEESGRPVSGEVVSYLHRAVEGVVRHEFRKVTIQISAAEKVVVEATKKGIRVSREIKNTKESEAEMIL